MGAHPCQFCKKASGSFDVEIQFADGQRFVVPELIVHFIVVHDYCPPENFMHAVLHQEVTETDFQQTRGMQRAEPIGYLPGTYPTDVSEIPRGAVPTKFCTTLIQILENARSTPGYFSRESTLLESRTL